MMGCNYFEGKEYKLYNRNEGNVLKTKYRKGKIKIAQKGSLNNKPHKSYKY